MVAYDALHVRFKDFITNSIMKSIKIDLKFYIFILIFTVS